jgi:disulfide bond formation protein DsbB
MAVGTRSFAGFVVLVSMIVLGLALASQYWGGLLPCELCEWQRWVWASALVIAAIAWVLGNRAKLSTIAKLCVFVFGIGTGFAAYHVAIEQQWVAGPSACTASGTSASSIEGLRRQILGHQPVLCDQVQWSLFGISLAGWNLVASALMAGICLVALRRKVSAAPAARLERVAE